MKKQWLVTAFSRTLAPTLTRPSSISRSFSSQPTSTFAVKKVTKSNFDSALEDLRHLIRAADFVSIDLEMTGVTSAPWRESFDFDRFDIRYLKVKDSVEKFAVVQFGVCPFRWDSSKKSFIAHPHTFYVFPRKEISTLDGPAYEFLCQTTSMDFLAKYKFDFNACIYEGVSYLSRAQEDAALNSLNSAYEDELSTSDTHLKEVVEIPSVGIADVLFTERMKNRFCEWRDGLLRTTSVQSQFQGNSIDSKAQLKIVFFKMHPALELDGFTSHQLRLIQLVIRKHFNDLIYIRTNSEKGAERKLVVYVDAENEKQALMKDLKDTKRKEAEMKVKTAVGLRHVIDLLSSEKKLVVGHNCFLDVAHVHNKFLGPLPSTVEEFASSIHKHFPRIIDTKYLLKTDTVIRCMMNKNGTSLSKAFSFLCRQISSAIGESSVANWPSLNFEVRVDEMRSSNWNSGATHEAGYDAFMTGCVFAQACSYIGIDFNSESQSTGLAYNRKLQKYMNHLYISWRNGSVIDLTTGKSIPEPSFPQNLKQRYPDIVFPNIVLLWGFSPDLKPKVLKDCVSKVFGLDNVTSIYYLDKTAAFIQFSKKEHVLEFLVVKETLEKSSNDVISVLHPLYKVLEGGTTCAAGYEVYKEICSSPVSKVLFADQAKAVNIKRKSEEEELKEEVRCYEAESPSSYCNTKTEARQTNDSSRLKYSCVELIDALCNPDSQYHSLDRNPSTDVHQTKKC